MDKSEIKLLLESYFNENTKQCKVNDYSILIEVLSSNENVIEYVLKYMIKKRIIGEYIKNTDNSSELELLLLLITNACNIECTKFIEDVLCNCNYNTYSGQTYYMCFEKIVDYIFSQNSEKLLNIFISSMSDIPVKNSIYRKIIEVAKNTNHPLNKIVCHEIIVGSLVWDEENSMLDFLNDEYKNEIMKKSTSHDLMLLEPLGKNNNIIKNDNIIKAENFN